MQVGPRGEGEREVLVRLVCGLVATAVGLGFVGTVVGNFGGHVSWAAGASSYVGIVLLTIFLPELATILRSRRS
jgi:uncharacterized protein (DUF697 family)